jgi:hypothetical protein
MVLTAISRFDPFTVLRFMHMDAEKTRPYSARQYMLKRRHYPYMGFTSPYSALPKAPVGGKFFYCARYQSPGFLRRLGVEHDPVSEAVVHLDPPRRRGPEHPRPSKPAERIAEHVFYLFCATQHSVFLEARYGYGVKLLNGRRGQYLADLNLSAIKPS